MAKIIKAKFNLKLKYLLKLKPRLSFPQFKLLPSDRQLVHHECYLHRGGSDPRLLEIPSSCRRIPDDNPFIFNSRTFFND